MLPTDTLEPLPCCCLSLKCLIFNHIHHFHLFKCKLNDFYFFVEAFSMFIQHHSSKASILRHSDFFTVQLSHPYITTGKTIALTRRTFVGKVMSLLFNMLSRLVITFLPRSKHVLISWLQSPSDVILEPIKIKHAYSLEGKL